MTGKLSWITLAALTNLFFLAVRAHSLTWSTQIPVACKLCSNSSRSEDWFVRDFKSHFEFLNIYWYSSRVIQFSQPNNLKHLSLYWITGDKVNIVEIPTEITGNTPSLSSRSSFSFSYAFFTAVKTYQNICWHRSVLFCKLHAVTTHSTCNIYITKLSFVQCKNCIKTIKRNPKPKNFWEILKAKIVLMTDLSSFFFF